MTVKVIPPAKYTEEEYKEILNNYNLKINGLLLTSKKTKEEMIGTEPYHIYRMIQQRTELKLKEYKEERERKEQEERDKK